MKNLIIIGTGGFARELYWTAKESIGYESDYLIKGFIDGDIKSPDTEYIKLPLPLLGDINNYVIEENDVFIIAIGTPSVREKLSIILKEKKGNLINIIHKSAILQGHSDLGTGIIICAYTVIGSDVHIGDSVVINTASTVGHDSFIDDYTCLMAHVDITGFSRIGRKVYFGSGSRVLPHAKIDDNSFIGAGSVVLRHVKTGVKVFGVPAMPVEF